MGASPIATSNIMRKFKRYDMRRVLADKKVRRQMIARSTVVAMAREGIDITLEQALESYDNALVSPLPSKQKKG